MAVRHMPQPPSRRPKSATEGLMSVSRGVRLPEACRRLGFSVRTGRRRLADGTFPIPYLPRVGQSAYIFSTVLIDEYLADESTKDVAKMLRRSLRVIRHQQVSA